MAAAPTNEAFDYAKALYTNITEWYKDAHGRAQSILTLDGAFVTLLAGVIVLKSEDVAKITQDFGVDTTISLVIMAIFFVLSGAFAVGALLPLGLRESAIKRKYSELREADNSTPAPSVMWYSQFIRQMTRTEFIAQAHKMTTSLHEKALTSQIHTLSQRLAYKYRLVYAGFVCTSLAILALLFATASYVWRAG